MLEDTWPLDLITSNERQPLEVFTPTAFGRRFYLLITWRMSSSSGTGSRPLVLRGRTAYLHGFLIASSTRRIRSGASVLKFSRGP